MNKKRFIILTVILVLSLAVNVTVYAFNSDSSVQNIDEVEIIKQTKPNDKIFFTLNSKKAELSYKGKISSLQNEYVDANGDEYIFDEKNRCLGYYNKDESAKTESLEISQKSLDVAVSESEAKNIADDFAAALYGKMADGYKYLKVELSENGEYYTFEYDKKAGKDGFIYLSGYYVDVYLNGEIRACNMPMPYDADAVNVDLLDKLSKEQIEAYADRLAKDIYADSLVDSTIDDNVGVFLTVKNGNYILEVPVILELKDDVNETYNFGKEFYYEIR